MLTTSEIRWFYQGEVAPAIKNWFTKDVLRENCQTFEQREDWYLRIPGCEFLGVKLRQKQLESKLRVAELGVLYLSKNVIGSAEKWVKWSCDDPEAESLITSEVVAKGEWVKVEKARSQIRYLIADDGSLIPTSTTGTSQVGCNVELTQLIVDRDRWWSLGFETSGKSDDLMPILEAVTNKVFQTFPEEELSLRNSYAYPKWLSLFV
ncbi:hypothetical protein [Floridanema evergladense]|uniref:CYTH domain-containing protein n=1 Tax=Floridaenema evergladense BLCC-F167 TaxID=3153639 RepID=A0ABV4WVS5_9CYAN